MVWKIGKMPKYGVWGVVYISMGSSEMTKYWSVESREEGTMRKND